MTSQFFLLLLLQIVWVLGSPLPNEEYEITKKIGDSNGSTAGKAKARGVRRLDRRDFTVVGGDAVVGLSMHGGSSNLSARAAPEGAATAPRQVAPLIELLSEVAYSADVTIGGIVFKLFVDTGSSHTWVTLSNVTCVLRGTGEACSFPTHLPLTSPNEAWLAPLDSRYLDGSGITGGLVRRSVTIAGLTVADQIIGAADKANTTIADGSFDGLLGLGLAGGTRTAAGAPPLYQPLVPSLVAGGKLTPDAVFTVALMGSADIDGTRDAGLLAFGGIPAALTPTSVFAAAPVLSDGAYAIYLDGYAFVGGSAVSLYPEELVAVFDTGTFITRVPPVVASAIFNLMPGTPASACTGDPNEKCIISGLWKVPCNGVPPSFAIVVAGVVFPFPPENMIISDGSGICFAGITAGAAGDPALIGYTFMAGGPMIVHDLRVPAAPQLAFATYRAT